MASPLRVVGLDPGLHFGWCALDASRNARRHGMRQFGGEPGKCFGDSLEWLSALLGYFRPELIAYEAPWREGSGFKVRLGMESMILLAAHRAGIPTREISPASLKLAATGSGKADKAAMMSAARSLGFSISTDHESDAIHAARFGMGLISNVRAKHQRKLDRRASGAVRSSDVRSLRL